MNFAQFFITNVLQNANFIGVVVVLASLVSALGAILEQNGFIRRIFNKQKQEKKETHKISIMIDNSTITIETADVADAEAALKLARAFQEKAKISTGTENSSKTVTGPSTEASTDE